MAAVRTCACSITRTHLLVASLELCKIELFIVVEMWWYVGNDLLARLACPTCWITSPLDTALHLKWLIGFFEKFERYHKEQGPSK